MAIIYLSPSTQQYNEFVIGGSEEYYMNLIADAMIPYLQSSGIQFTRNTPDMTAGSSIRQSNAGNYDLHLAIHSNASPEGQTGENRGTVIYYYPMSSKGKRAAEIIEQNFEGIYPNPELVKILPITSLGEVSRTRAPSVLVEVAYHDNIEDANWIKDNIDLIARTLVQSISDYLYTGDVTEGKKGTVTLQSGYLNVRSGPSLNSPVVTMVPNGTTLTILGTSGDWYNVEYNGIRGYAASRYIK